MKLNAIIVIESCPIFRATFPFEKAAFQLNHAVRFQKVGRGIDLLPR
jgi:hypothetical protein